MDSNSYTEDEFRRVFVNQSLTALIHGPVLKLDVPRQAWLFAAYLLTFVVGTAGNVWVAVVVGRVIRNCNLIGVRKGARGMQIYILALCCCDLLAIACMLALLVDIAYSQWVIPYRFICKLELAGECLNKFGSPFLLTALSGYCYMYICRPRRLSLLTFGSTRVSLATVAGCVTTASALGSPVYVWGDVYYLVKRNDSQAQQVIPKCSVRMPETVLTIFNMYSFLLGYILPAVLFTCFYSAVLYFVYVHSKRMRGRKARYFWRVVRTSMCLVIFYLVCWTPYWIIMLWVFYENGARMANSVVLIYLVHLLPYVNCSGYPILYTLLNRNIAEDYRFITSRRSHVPPAVALSSARRLQPRLCCCSPNVALDKRAFPPAVVQPTNSPTGIPLASFENCAICSSDS